MQHATPPRFSDLRVCAQIQRLQESLANWKLKIAANVRECEDRNKQLRQEKEQISKHFQTLKSKMSRMRSSHTQRLQSLSVRSRDGIKKLEDLEKKAQNILLLAELNRKLETEREKVLPFHETDVANGDVPSEFEAEATGEPNIVVAAVVLTDDLTMFTCMFLCACCSSLVVCPQRGGQDCGGVELPRRVFQTIQQGHAR